jgi:hypothetical protein
VYILWKSREPLVAKPLRFAGKCVSDTGENSVVALSLNEISFRISCQSKEILQWETILKDGC